jgi:hypothetical protein
LARADAACPPSERADKAADPADADAKNDRIGAPRLLITRKPPTAQADISREAANSAEYAM